MSSADNIDFSARVARTQSNSDTCSYPDECSMRVLEGTQNHGPLEAGFCGDGLYCVVIGLLIAAVITLFLNYWLSQPQDTNNESQANSEGNAETPENTDSEESSSGSETEGFEVAANILPAKSASDNKFCDAKEVVSQTKNTSKSKENDNEKDKTKMNNNQENESSMSEEKIITAGDETIGNEEINASAISATTGNCEEANSNENEVDLKNILDEKSEEAAKTEGETSKSPEDGENEPAENDKTISPSDENSKSPTEEFSDALQVIEDSPAVTDSENTPDVNGLENDERDIKGITASPPSSTVDLMANQTEPEADNT